MPREPMRMAVFGGSFDPVHNGHLEVARRAQRVFDLERILWIPAAIPPHKIGQDLVSGALRLAMLAIATADRLDWDISAVELDREGPSFTYDTLLQVPELVAPWLLPREEGGYAPHRRELELFLILGSDNLPGLPRWRNAEDVLSLAQPIVAWREGDPDEHLAGLVGTLPEPALERLRRGFLRLPPLPESSTDVRAALRRGEVPRDSMHPEVLDFIAEKGLYGWPEGTPIPPDDADSGAGDGSKATGEPTV